MIAIGDPRRRDHADYSEEMGQGDIKEFTQEDRFLLF